MIRGFQSRFALTLLVAVFLSVIPTLATNPPALFFSDVLSGPNSGGENVSGFAGAYVTLYGNFFGASQGSSAVTLNGANCLRVASWGAIYQNYQKIVVQLGSSCTSGSFVVTTSAGTSNGLPFTIRSGHIYFVATSGSDSNSGAATSPFATIAHAVHGAMTAGDITYVHGGVVAATDDGYGSALNISTQATAANPIALVAYPGEQPQFGGPSNSRGVIDYGGPVNYWTIAGFKFLFTGSTEAFHLYAVSTGWRLVANDISCPNGSGSTGCVTSDGATSFSFLGNSLHDTGCPGSMTGSYSGCKDTQKTYHAFYFGDLNDGNSNHDMNLGWNVVFNIYGCRGLMFHSKDSSSGWEAYSLQIHDNLIHDVRCDGIAVPNSNPDKGAIQIYNNIIYHTGTGPDPSGNAANYSCVLTGDSNGSPKTNVEVYNNTCYDGGSRGALEGDAGAWSFFIPTRMRDNVTYSLAGESYMAGSSVSGDLSGSNNLWFGVGSGPYQTTGNITSDPLFSSVSSKDFHLLSGSPAIGAGVNTGILMDFDGVLRPPSSAFAVGALEFSTGVVSTRPAPPTNLQAVVN